MLINCRTVTGVLTAREKLIGKFESVGKLLLRLCAFIGDGEKLGINSFFAQNFEVMIVKPFFFKS